MVILTDGMWHMEVIISRNCKLSVFDLGMSMFNLQRKIHNFIK